MKVTSTASAVRVTMSPTEIRDLELVIEAAKRLGAHFPARIPDMIAALSIGAADVRAKQSAKRAEKDYTKRIEQERRARERYFMIGDHYSITAARADYADVSTDPDYQIWVDLQLREILSKPIPEQCEIRRDAWLVRVVRLNADALGDIAGSECTQTGDDAEIRPIAEKLIARWEARERIAA